MTFSGRPLFLVILGCVSLEALAAQDAKVIGVDVVLYNLPNHTSPPIATLARGSTVKVSNEFRKDVHGEYGYKAQSPKGEYGWVRANEIVTAEIEGNRQWGGYDIRHHEDADRRTSHWTFLLRGMGLAGKQTFTTGATYGGEGEFTICPLWNEKGYYHRILGVGVAYQVQRQGLASSRLIAGSLVYRIFTHARAEPEVRLRLGKQTPSEFLVFGANLGVRYPFSLYEGIHFAGYLEAGSLIPVSRPEALAGAQTSIAFWVSAGIGLHFF